MAFGARAVIVGVLVTAAAGGAGMSIVSGGGGGGGACAQATASVPDGPDPWGGCFPGPSNTGPNASEASMSSYTGSCDITAANVTIDSKVVNCDTVAIGAGASGLLIKNSYVKGGIISENGASFTVQDSLVDNGLTYAACSGAVSEPCAAGTYACGSPVNQTTACGIGYTNFTVLRTEVTNSNRAAYCENNCLIQDNYFHGTNLWPDYTNHAHASSVRNEQNNTLRHNSLACDYQGPNYEDKSPAGDLGCSADMSGYPDFAPIKNDTIDRNLFIANPGADAFHGGAGFCVYGGSTSGKSFSGDPTNGTNIKFTDNVFQRGSNGKCGSFGHVTDFDPLKSGNVWTGNKFDDGATAGPS